MIDLISSTQNKIGEKTGEEKPTRNNLLAIVDYRLRTFSTLSYEGLEGLDKGIDLVIMKLGKEVWYGRENKVSAGLN